MLLACGLLALTSFCLSFRLGLFLGLQTIGQGRVHLLTLVPYILLEFLKLLLYLLLLLSYLRRVGLVDEHLALHVGCLVDLAVVAVHREIVVGRHVGDIVEVAGHDGQSAQIGRNVVILQPEERFGSDSAAITKSVIFQKHRTKGSDFGVIGARALVEIAAFLQIVAFHLCRGNVIVSHSVLAIFLFIVDIVAVEDLLHIRHTVLFSKRLIAIQLICVC